MRIVIAGSGSFIARAIAAEAAGRALPVLGLRHDAALEGVIGPGDCLINFALDPRYKTGPYEADADCDLRAARAAAAAGARFVMLSTRRVYGPGYRWNAVEGMGAGGDETAYGRNKARSEGAITDLPGASIFRLSNIFGYEYDQTQPRGSFLGLLLASLKQKHTIFFDMHPDTQRDFLPVEQAAKLILDRVQDGSTGVYNLGSGNPLRCGSLAQWILDGFGGGELVWTSPAIKDEFFLNMDKWRGQFALPVDEDTIKDYCMALGRRLQCEKS